MNFLNNISLSIVIPIYKEKKNLIHLAKKISFHLRKIQYEVIFVDDNSEDGTEKIFNYVKKFILNSRLLIRKNEKRDLSQSCIYGFNYAIYENILVMDGDLQHHPKYILPMLKKFLKNNVDILIACRKLSAKNLDGLNFFRIYASKFLVYLLRKLLKIKSSDPLSGFFIFKKQNFLRNQKFLYGKGYKILVDIVLSSQKKPTTIDYKFDFKPRFKGKSKINLNILFLLFIFIIKKLIKK